MPSTPVQCSLLVRRPATPTSKSPLNSKQGSAKYAFTPKPSSKHIPRAWERKPSTPFAPRTEFHKIWKRCEPPVVNAQVDKAEGKEGGDKSRLRPVKKLRVGQRETIQSATTKVEKPTYVRRRKKVSTADAKSPRVKRPSDSGLVLDTSRPRDDELENSFKKSLEDVEGPVSPAAESSVGSDISPEMKASPSTIHEANVGVPKITSATELHIPSEADDTKYLHAFLDRAKASKAQQTILNPAVDVPLLVETATTSPQRTPLKSRSKSGKPQRSPQKFEAREQTTSSITSEEQASPLRKSTRTRLRFQPNHNHINPSSIPLRRSNGTEFVFLQHTDAQQIAMTTRSNTRKNKGEALIPKKKIELLSSQIQSSPMKVTNRGSKSKQVSWVEGLFQGESDVAGDTASEVQQEWVETTKPARRSQRSKSGNGTPAPKKYIMEAGSMVEPETPSAKSRKSARSKA